MSDNTKMREAVLKILASYKQEMERYGYYSSNPGVSVDDFEEIADEIVAWQAARTVPEASSSIFASRCPMCSYQHGHQIGCENNPIDIALRAATPEPKK